MGDQIRWIGGMVRLGHVRLGFSVHGWRKRAVGLWTGNETDFRADRLCSLSNVFRTREFKVVRYVREVASKSLGLTTGICWATEDTEQCEETRSGSVNSVFKEKISVDGSLADPQPLTEKRFSNWEPIGSVSRQKSCPRAGFARI